VEPVFSIILTVYNNEEVIGRHLHSLLALTREPFELIVVLDGCTDGSEEGVLRVVQLSNCWDKVCIRGEWQMALLTLLTDVSLRAVSFLR
jgi:cellulose synthase/poly-beta-1,6-N-acetylglucosamine synthase-like glycosyltransferase